MTTRTNNKPTHKLYAITKSANTDKGFWQEIGAAWEHRDGDGFNVKLLLLPLVGQDIVIRKVKAAIRGPQLMLEGILGIRRCPMPENQFAHQLRHPDKNLCLLVY